MYGGTNGITFFDSVSMFDLKTLSWKDMYENTAKPSQPIQKIPLGRIATSMCYAADLNVVVVFGGCGFNDDSNDLYIIDLN